MGGFSDKVKEFGARVSSGSLKNKEGIENIKQFKVLPFLEIMGYDVRSSNELECGYADGKYDYAIMMDDSPVIVVKCMEFSDNHQVEMVLAPEEFKDTRARVGVLTNGVEYSFYSLESRGNSVNLVLSMDMGNISEGDISKLYKFRREELFISNTEVLIRGVLEDELKNPSKEFQRILVSKLGGGKRTDAFLTRHLGVMFKAIDSYKSDMVRERVLDVLEKVNISESDKNKIIGEIVTGSYAVSSTFKEGLSCDESLGLGLIKGMFSYRNDVSAEDIVGKKNLSYLAINYKDNSWCPICRLYFGVRKMKISIPKNDKLGSGKTEFEDYELSDISDIVKHKRHLSIVISYYINNKKG